MNTPIISARAVEKHFDLPGGGKVQVLRGIDVDIARGEFVAIMGASGSGKSTLLYALSGIDLPTAGTITVDGEEITAMTQRQLEALRLDRIGFVFQQPHLLDGATIRDNVLLPVSWKGRKHRDAALAASEKRMEQLSIGHVADNDAATVSGGQRQRAGIARALANDPVLIFADEPTGALDSVSAAQVLDVFEELHRAGLTIVMVTHDPNVAARADRIIRVVDGKVEGKVDGKVEA